ncbi:MAG: fatty acid desaturase family protein [Nevskia sp.]|nr:fatty acid desaturase family protein [Nevskia sp.]
MNGTPIVSSTPAELPVATRRKLHGLLTPGEVAALSRRSDWRGAWAILSTWAVIAAAFALAALWPNPLSFVVALCLIAGRQLALAVLQHEAAHGTLFKTRWLNEHAADWLCARPVWQHLAKYRAHHLVHHTRTGTDEDIDISLHEGYPVSAASLRRKLLRDAIGITGLKLVLGRMLMDAGVLKWTVASRVEKLPQQGRHWWDYPAAFLRNAGGMLLCNLLLWAVLAAAGHGWLYGLWVLAQIAPFPLFVRIRSIAEHGMLPRATDMFLNTRTTRATLFDRLFVAPCHVNYHLEHHAMASVPYYRLPRLHALLRQRGAVAAPAGYGAVLRLAGSGP